MKLIISVLPAAVFFSVLGWLSADWRAGNVDFEIRNSLLLQAVRISQAIDPELVKKLTFTPDDRGTPAFEQIRKQMVAYGQIISQRGIYSMVLRDGHLIFGPENYADDDPMASEPGTIYEEPTIEDYEMFTGRKPIAIGPVTDEYGTFISALAPVYDPRTGEVLMVIGIDFLSDDWQTAVNAARNGPLAITLILILVLLAGSATVYWRNQLPEKQGLFLRQIETIMAGVLGLTLTVGATLLVLEAENRERLRIFIRSSYAIAEAVSDTFRDISGDVAAIARFKEGSIRVDRQEFIVFVEPMTRSSAIRGYQLAFSVPAMDKTMFEAEIERDGVESFFIWEKTLQGAKIPVSERNAYYPVCYVAPWGDNVDSVGFDLGSDPLLKITLEESVRTGLVTATGAIGLGQDDVKEPGMLILHPIFADNSQSVVTQSNGGQDRRLRGFAVGVIRLKSIMDVVLKKYSNEGLFVNMHLLDLTNEHGPTILGSYPHGRMETESVTMDSRYNGPCIQ